jgi:hypothetical protein
MAKIPYSHLFVADAAFFSETEQAVLLQLLRIRLTSAHIKEFHNTVLDVEFKKIGDVSHSEGKIKAAFKVVPVPEFLSDEDNDISTTIRYAFSLTDDPPYKAVILTSSEAHKSYLDNPHFKGSAIQILSGDSATTFVQNLYRQFARAREQSRMR